MQTLATSPAQSRVQAPVRLAVTLFSSYARLAPRSFADGIQLSPCRTQPFRRLSSQPWHRLYTLGPHQRRSTTIEVVARAVLCSEQGPPENTACWRAGEDPHNR
jgi:hypothetical protein